MNTTNHPRRFSSTPPFNPITDAAGHEIEDRLDAFRERHPGARIEIARVEHQPTCATRDGRRCNCAAPRPVVIVGGRAWLRLHADGGEEDVTPPPPTPAELEADEGFARSWASMPVRDWLRVGICQTAATIIGDGDSARFVGGPIDEPLTRAIRRLERPRTPSLP
jgi:hypothetical protein